MFTQPRALLLADPCKYSPGPAAAYSKMIASHLKSSSDDDLLFVRVFDSPKAAETFAACACSPDAAICMRRRQTEPNSKPKSKEDQLLRGKTEARSRGHDSALHGMIGGYENLRMRGISHVFPVALGSVTVTTSRLRERGFLMLRAARPLGPRNLSACPRSGL